MLELRKISKYYPTADTGRMLQVLYLEVLKVRANEKVALVGPSGSGKSTLLNIIAGIIRPTTGSIKLNGQELTGLSEKAWDRVRTLNIGYVFQNFYLLPGFSALENVLLAMQFAGTLMGKERIERARELLCRVGLEARLHHRPHQLSNGEQQRVAIARALANEPCLVMADEPTANLDAANASLMIELLTEVCAEQGAALLLSTHDHSLLRYMDRTVHLAGAGTGTAGVAGNGPGAAGTAVAADTGTTVVTGAGNGAREVRAAVSGGAAEGAGVASHVHP